MKVSMTQLYQTVKWVIGKFKAFWLDYSRRSNQLLKQSNTAIPQGLKYF